MPGRLYLMAVTIVLMHLACKKDTIEAEPAPATPVLKHYPVSNELKHWGLFKVGTYWIYRTDSVLSKFDSVYVTSVTSATKSVAYTDDTTAIVEEIVVWLNHGPGYYFSNYFKLTSYIRDEISESYRGVPIFNLDTTQLSTQYASGIYANHTLSNYSHYGVNYGAVRNVEWLYTINAPSHPTAYYSGVNIWKRNVGMIKESHMNNMGNPVSLIRSHVVQ